MKKIVIDKRLCLILSAVLVILCLSAILLVKSCKTEQAVTPEIVKKIIVIDAGHGKPSSQMSEAEKEAEGYMYNDESDGWGEWRHYKRGTFGEDCHGSDCNGDRCWYGVEYTDRDTEPDLNLKNALSAKKYLEEMGYEVRMTRTTNEETPSMNKRVSYCFPNNDINSEPDASAYVCLHSNAGGGRGTSYIRLDGEYEQSYIDETYISASNEMADIINKKIAAVTSLAENPPINSPHLILFNKSPVPIAYLEIGFYDNASDLEIIENSHDSIGKAIAEGIDEYLKKAV